VSGREIDVLVGTDCISEGQNLQDCDYLVNYDIHWNPVRIIQRFGRIDRIGSVNDRIQMVSFWSGYQPRRVHQAQGARRNRMVIADLAATADDNVLTQVVERNGVSARNSSASFREEVIEMEDVRAGVSITDLGLNDFRMDLLGYVKEHS